MSAALLFGLVLALLSTITFVVIGVSVRLGRPGLGLLAPAARARFLTSAGLAPLVLPSAAMLACALPSLLALAGLGEDHCDHHGGHVHLCVFHAPTQLGVLVQGLGLALAVVVALGLARELLFHVAAARAASALLAAAKREGDVLVLPGPHAFSAAVGLFSPVVVLSAGLRETLDGQAIDAVLAHERAHVVRHDALRLSVIRALWSLTPRWLAEPLSTELSLACEEACDAEAAVAVADPLVVADAIVAAARAARRVPAPLSPAALSPTAVSFGPNATERRVRALLDARPGASPTLPLLSITSALLLATASSVHHLTETFVGLFLG